MSIKQRSMIEIMACILDAAMKGAKKTEIIRSVSLTHDMLKSYLLLLKERGLTSLDEEKCFTTERNSQKALTLQK